MKQRYSPLYVLTLWVLLSSRAAKAQCGLAAFASAGTAGNNTTIGTLAWSGTGNTVSQDGSYASAAPFLPVLGTRTTNYLTLSNFGFNIPTGYTICGIGLSISRDYSTTLSLEGYATDNIVQLATINSPTSLTLLGTNQGVTGAGGAWNYGTIATTSYGGNGNTMGATLTPTDVNAANFGVAISADVVSLISLVVQANIDKVSMSIYTDPQFSLPIKLENFSVDGSAAGNILRWTANAATTTGAAGSSNAGRVAEFVIQRSADGTTWRDLATLDASTAVANYSYTDPSPLSGPNYYRLELLNTSGVAGYSVTAIIASKTNASASRAAHPPAIAFYPNPFHDIIEISAPAPFTLVRLSDLAGRTLWQERYPGGATTTRLRAGGLPPGIYLVNVDGTTYKVMKN
jgi:hypothetical protein